MIIPPSAETDLIIVGGGPAGSSAAITAVIAGLRVILLENSVFPRHRPGETLHPGIEPLLCQLGVWEEVLAAGFIRHAGHWMEWGGARQFVAFGENQKEEWKGFQAWREDFDAILLDRAKSLGVRVIHSCRALHPLVLDGVAIGAKTLKGNFTAGFVIDAAGGRHWLAKGLNLEIKSYTPRLIIRYGYASGSLSACDASPSLVADNNGWTWIAKVRSNKYHWARLPFNPKPPTDNWLPPGLMNFIHDCKVRGSDVSWRAVTNPAGPGYFLSGDAASVLDPVSSHGVLRAMMSGIMAAHLIVQIRRNKVSSAEAVSSYRHWMMNWFLTDAVKLCEFYAKLYAPPSWLPGAVRRLNWTRAQQLVS